MPLMKNFTNLDNVAHAEIRVDSRLSAEYGDNLSQVQVFVTEFENLQREYAVFFKKTDAGEYYAMTLLGLDSDENLFLKDGGWDAHYIPAVIQKGPFQIGVPDAGDPIIKIDLESPRIDSEVGEPLFKSNGGLSPYLTHISKVLEQIHVGLEMNDKFFKELADASLIEAVTLNLKLDDGKSYSVPDVFSIDEAAFQALSGSVLEKFHSSGLLALCQYVLSSRKNIQHLLDRKMIKAHASG